MRSAPRIVTLQVELRYDPTAEEKAIFDGGDEDAQKVADRAVLRSAVSLLEGQEFAASRFEVGTAKASTGSSWINRFA